MKGAASFGLAVTDITTGEFRFTQVADEQFLLDEISRVQPSELLVAERATAIREQLTRNFPARPSHLRWRDYFFSDAATGDSSKNQLRQACHWQAGMRAASAVVGYLERNAADSLEVLRDLEPYVASSTIGPRRNDPNQSRTDQQLTQGDRKGSLLAVIDRTLTPMGARRCASGCFIHCSMSTR